jgi:DNA-binding XRE family transcriptional regulator
MAPTGFVILNDPSCITIIELEESGCGLPVRGRGLFWSIEPSFAAWHSPPARSGPKLDYTSNRSTPRYPNEISRYRRQLGLTQAELAKSLGVVKETVTSWECGYVIPRLPRLFEVTRQLDTVVENLYWPLYRPNSPGAEEIRRGFPHGRGDDHRLPVKR